jgi:hypothetical protein
MVCICRIKDFSYVHGMCATKDAVLYIMLHQQRVTVVPLAKDSCEESVHSQET